MSNHYYRPAYMPANEDALMKWFDNYFKNIPSYATTFQIETQDIELQQGILDNIKDSLSVTNSLHEYRKAVTELKNQLLYGAKNGSVPVPTPENINLTGPSMIGGLIKLVDDQNKTKIFPSPAYNDTIGKDLGLIPVEHEPVEPKDLVANSTINCDGKHANIFTVIQSPATSQAIYVDKHDGKGLVFVNVSEQSHYACPLELPAEQTLWTFKVSLRVKTDEVGTAAYVNILVKRT